MNKKIAIISLFYSFGQVALGLLLHPYVTMQSLVKKKVFVWMSATPLFILAGTTISWKFLFVPVVQVVFSCSTTYYFACDVLSFISNTIVFFCWYWQVLLLYLLVRFRLASRF